MNLNILFTIDLTILAITAILSLFLVFKDKRKFLLFILIPIIVLSGLDAHKNVNAMRGLSRYDYIPDGEISLISVVIDKTNGIYIWYFDEEKKEPRSIRIPYTEKNEKKLTAAMGKLRAGQNAFIELKESQKPAGNAIANFIGPKSIDIIEYDFSSKFQSKKQN